MKRRRRAIWLVHVAAAAIFLACVARFGDPDTGFTSLIRFGANLEDRVYPPIKPVPRYLEPRSVGYDGQFYAQLAADPLLRDPRIDRAMDNAPFRARRILFSWTAWLAGAGRPGAIVQAYALQNVVSWLLLGVLLLYWFPPDDARGVALWLVTLFGGGVIWSVRSALLDGPSLLLIAAGMFALERGWRWSSALVLGISGLGRETNVLAAAAHVGPTDVTRWRTLLARLGCVLLIALPFLVWFDYLFSIYRSTVFTAGNTIAAPFEGYLWKWQRTLADLAEHGWRSGARLSLIALVAISTQAAYLLVRPAWNNHWWRLGVAYALMLPVLGRPAWEGDPSSTLRVLLPLALAFNVLIRRERNPYVFWIWLTAGNVGAVLSLAFFEFGWLSWL